jgi:hypothetical protein
MAGSAGVGLAALPWCARRHCRDRVSGTASVMLRLSWCWLPALGVLARGWVELLGGGWWRATLLGGVEPRAIGGGPAWALGASREPARGAS